MQNNKKLVAKIEDLILDYRVRKIASYSIKSILSLQFRNFEKLELHRVLENVSLEIYEGETLGVIGKNGAGKSTLLKLLSTILHPTAGRIMLWKKPLPLLGIGAGFNYSLSGHDNIYLYGAFLGRSKEKNESLYEWIKDFSELGTFLDHQLSTYSQGMIARLGFSVALADIPDFLLIDEVLSVGDEYFKNKCKTKLKEICASGSTVVIVSHSLEDLMTLSDRIIWVNNMKIEMEGEPQVVIQEYQKSVAAQKKNAGT